jgi:phosphoribosylanthranilate isomerase
MARTRIKICGLRDEDAVAAAVEAGADAVGFVFVRESPRVIDPELADNLVSRLPPWVSSVGVFQDPTLDEFCEVEEACPFLTMSQFHGREDVKLIKGCGPDVIKSVVFDGANPTAFAQEVTRWSLVDEVATILVDGPRAGSGETIDWKSLAGFLEDTDRPIILAGGLTPENVGEAIEIVRPYAVDVSSGVERERGVKDADLIEAFCRAVRRADTRLDG